jgi:hypothetical protein
MNEKDTIELVNRHAEALNRGNGLGYELAQADRAVGQLLTVASRVKTVLRPVAPRAAFVRDLKQQLINEASQHQAQRHQQWLMLAAGLGGLVYGVGVLAVGYRTSLWVLGLVTVALGWKKRQQANAKTAH